jgi:amino acid transporter
MPNPGDTPTDPFARVCPFFGMMLSVPAIFFAFDGFYGAAGIRNKLEQPKKFSSILTIGLLIVAGIYLLMSLSLLFYVKNGDGTFSSTGFLPS